MFKIFSIFNAIKILVFYLFINNIPLFLSQIGTNYFHFIKCKTFFSLLISHLKSHIYGVDIYFMVVYIIFFWNNFCVKRFLIYVTSREIIIELILFIFTCK